MKGWNHFRERGSTGSSGTHHPNMGGTHHPAMGGTHHPAMGGTLGVHIDKADSTYSISYS